MEIELREAKEVGSVLALAGQAVSLNKRAGAQLEQGDDEMVPQPLGAGRPMLSLTSMSRTSRPSRLWITRRRRLGGALASVEEGEARLGEDLEANMGMSVVALWAGAVDAEVSSKGPTSAVASTKGGAGETGTRFVKINLVFSFLTKNRIIALASRPLSFRPLGSCWKRSSFTDCPSFVWKSTSQKNCTCFFFFQISAKHAQWFIWSSVCV